MASRAEAAYLEAQQGIEVARTRLVTAQARRGGGECVEGDEGRRAVEATVGEGRDLAAAMRRSGGGCGGEQGRDRICAGADQRSRVGYSGGREPPRAGWRRTSAGLRPLEGSADGAGAGDRVSRALAAAEAKVRQNKAIVKQARLNLERDRQALP